VRVEDALVRARARAAATAPHDRDVLVAIVGSFGFVYDRDLDLIHVRVFGAQLTKAGHRTVYIVTDEGGKSSTERSRERRLRLRAQKLKEAA